MTAANTGTCPPLPRIVVLARLARSEPLDGSAIDAKNTGRGGLVLTRVIEHAFDWLDAPPVRVHGKDVPLPYAANLEKLALVTTAEVVAAVKSVCCR